jgi:hypothetical protein
MAKELRYYCVDMVMFEPHYKSSLVEILIALNFQTGALYYDDGKPQIII